VAHLRSLIETLSHAREMAGDLDPLRVAVVETLARRVWGGAVHEKQGWLSRSEGGGGEGGGWRTVRAMAEEEVNS
jgi:hypothetical protein